MPEGYIHGYGAEEEERLRVQAAVLAPEVIDPLPIRKAARVLEIGCGSGAELELLVQRFPDQQFTGIELDARHLTAAHHLLPQQVALVQGDAYRLPFDSNSFDAVLTIWVLEHLADPALAMREALRVLDFDGLLVCTEVDNATMRFSADLPAIRHWWGCLCTRQQRDGGDPYVGVKLVQLAAQLGCTDILVEDVNPVSSLTMPQRRAEFVGYLENLMLSGARRLIATRDVTQADMRALQTEFARLRREPDIDFEYHGVRLVCRRPN